MQIKKITLSGLIIFLLVCANTLLAQTYRFNPVDSHHALYIPKGTGPFPAIILLHASAGVEKVDYEWAEWLKRNGYVVYIIDSFTPRGYKDRKSIGWDNAVAAQIADIPPAYHYLLTVANVDPQRIAILGFSMGGYDALRAMQISGKGTTPELKSLHIKAAASFYGVCKLISSDANFKNPVRIFVGQKDDRATFSACEALVNKKSKSLLMTSYPNARHGFDNPAFPPKKELVDEKGDKYNIGYNEKAREASMHDVLVYFNQNLK